MIDPKLPSQAEIYDARRAKTARISSQLEQPDTEASNWLLTYDDLTSACNGVERDPALSVYTEGNTVTLFTSTDRFFASVYHDIEDLPANDNASLWFTGWSVDDVPFVPQDDRNWKKTTFKEIIGRAIARNVNVHGIVWANLLEKEQNEKMQKWMNSVHSLKEDEAEEYRLILDDRLPHLTSSHHQKSIVLSTRDRTIAYVGGIDLTSERWDTARHDARSQTIRKERGIEVSYKGWVDSSVRLEGPATLDVAANFAARWNSNTPALSQKASLLCFENPPIENKPAVYIPKSSTAIVSDLKDDARFPNVSVQIVRTFSPEYENYDFATRGELSIYHARMKAIKNAKNFIYVEDQYFIFVSALRILLLEKLDTIQKLIIVTQKTAPEFSGEAYVKLLYEMIHPLREKAPNKVHVYTIKESHALYIHTKAVLVDDVFLSIGSSNWNQRSMTSDSEMAANMVGTELVTTPKDGLQVARLAFRFRCQKFSEFTRFPVSRYQKEWSLAESIQTLDRVAMDGGNGESQGLLTFFEVEDKMSFDFYSAECDEFVDPHDSYQQSG